MSYNKTYSKEDWTIIKPYQWSINHALINEVIPSLREVIMEWDSLKNTICFYFYHDGSITDAIEEVYHHISCLAHFHCLETKVNMEYKAIRLDYPELIPQREFVIYARKEPFVNPVDDSPLPKGEAAYYWESYAKKRSIAKRTEYAAMDWEIIGDFYWYVCRALWDEVIPDLRQVSMQWDPEERIVWNLFYHHGPLTMAIKEHYSFVDSIADCDASKGVQTCLRIIRIDYPAPLPRDTFIVYARKEPFVDPGVTQHETVISRSKPSLFSRVATWFSCERRSGS